MHDDDVSLVSLALALGPGERLALARQMAAVGGVVGLWRAGPEAFEGLSGETAERWAAIQALWRRVHVPSRPSTVDGPKALLACLDPFLPLAAVETVHAVFLDGRGRFLGTEEIARGSVDACHVHPREVFAPAIRARASAVAVVHNHPSGDPEPSAADRALTDRLAAAGRLVGIPLVDHVVVGRGDHRSLGGGQPDFALASGETACEAPDACECRASSWSPWWGSSRDAEKIPSSKRSLRPAFSNPSGSNSACGASISFTRGRSC